MLRTHVATVMSPPNPRKHSNLPLHPPWISAESLGWNRYPTLPLTPIASSIPIEVAESNRWHEASSRARS